MDEFSKATSQGYLYSDIPTTNFQVFPQRSILPPCMSPCMLALSLSPDLYSYPGYFLPFEKKDLSCNNAPKILTYEQVYGEFLLINECCGRTQSIVDSATPGQVLLGHIEKQASKSVSHTSPWILLQFLYPDSSIEFLP